MQAGCSVYFEFVKSHCDFGTMSYIYLIILKFQRRGFKSLPGLPGVKGRMAANNREVADSRTAGIFIRETAGFHYDSPNYESQFIK